MMATTKAAAKSKIDWTNGPVLAGVDILNKQELIDVPFAITATKYTVNARYVEYVWVEGERRDGSTFTFNDSSSTGVKEQISSYLESVGVKPGDPLDEWVEWEKPLIVPNGLRVSTYSVDVVNERNKTESKISKTFYLSVSGQRA